MPIPGAATRSRISELTGGLTRRVFVAGALVAALVGMMVVTLADAASEQQRADASAQHSANVLQVALLTEREVVDLETGIRGYAATGNRAFLAPWSAARAALPQQFSRLLGLLSDDPLQRRRAAAISSGVSAYVSDYTVPFVARPRPLRGAALTAFTFRGKRLVDSLRSRFATFDAAELNVQRLRRSQAEAADNRLLTLGAIVGVSVILALILFVCFVAGWVALPLRRVSSALTRVANGDRNTRLRETGTAEVQLLATSFNQAVRQLGQRERELEQSAAELQDAATYSASIVRSARDAHVSIDEEGLITSWNPAAERMFGWSEDEVMGVDLADLIIPEQLRERHRQGIQRFVKTQRTRIMGLGLELSALRRSGTEFPIQLAVACVEHQGRHRFHAFISDISARRAAQRELRTLADVVAFTHEAVITMDNDGLITSFNPGAERLFGYRSHEVMGRSVMELQPLGARREVAEHRLERLLSGESVREQAVTRRHKDGSTLYVDLSASPIRNERGDVIGGATILRDVTAQHELGLELSESEERFRLMFENAPVGNVLLTVDGRVEHANPAFGELCGRSRNQVLGMTLQQLLHPGDILACSDALRALVAGAKEQLSLELRFMSSTGTPVDIDAHATLLQGSDGGPAHILCQCHDVSERKRFEAQLQFMADHDPLTGLLNRRKFEAELDRHVSEVKRYGPIGALIVLDLDHFKHVNDVLGHNAGDELIVSMAGVLRSRLRESDVLARLGGDEFAVLLPHADSNDAREVAQALVDSVRASTTLLNGEHHRVTTSAGVAMFEARPEDITGETILVDADLAMYDAKEAGRDRFASYFGSDHRASRTKARLTWVRRIEQALDQERFTLVAQPILDLNDGTVHQHELLIRMLDDTGDLIPPTAFLYIAERFGLIGRIDEWVSGKAIELIENNPTLTLEINISGHSLGNETLLAAIENQISSSRVNPANLIFEVTETAAVANLADARHFAQTLRDLGCRFALDDFGAGFGSFYYLKHLPFDYIKIDGEFVQHVVTGQIDKLVIEAVVGIARGLGKETIAEFVTDARTLRVVRDLGVDYAQGFHIGEPAPLSDISDVPEGLWINRAP